MGKKLSAFELKVFLKDANDALNLSESHPQLTKINLSKSIIQREKRVSDEMSSAAGC